MSLITTYKEYLVQKIFLESLFQKNILTSDEIEEAVQEYKKTHLDLSLPSSKFLDFLVEKGTSSSVEKIDTILDSFSNDFSVIVREIYKIAISNSLYYSRWLKEIERLNSKAKKLESRINSLLLLKDESLGYFASITEDLVDLEEVDMENTTALVDIESKTITINRGSESSKSLRQLDTSSFSGNEASFYPLSKRTGTFYKEFGSSNSIKEIFKNEYSSWIGQISCNSNGEMISELKINLQKLISLSRITVCSKISSSNDQSTVSLQYSKDGYNWYLISVSNATQSYSNDNISWSFDQIEAAWIKLIFYKKTADYEKNNQYIYEYCIRAIKFYDNEFYSTNGNEFYSTSLSTVDNQDQIVKFAKATLTACDIVPNKTSLRYYLSASRDNLVWTDWKEISNSNSDNLLPKVLSFSGTLEYRNDSSSVILLNSSNSSSVIVREFDSSNTDTPIFKDNNFGYINVKIDVPSEEYLDLTSNTIEVWRNLSSSNNNYKVREISKGWSFNGQIYSCYFGVYNTDGLVIDFGDTKCIIDGNEITGRYTIPVGIHSFKTDSSNWYDISDLLSSITVSNESTLLSIDPLYPYNHKLLIEGIIYPLSFEGSKVYLGTDISAEYYCSRVSSFDLENKDIGYNNFAIVPIGIENYPSLGVLVKFDSAIVDYSNEEFLVKWKSSEEDSLYSYIKLKIELDTNNNYVSPSVSSYRIKLGV